MSRRRRLALGLGLLVTAAALLGARSWSASHVQEMTRDPGAPTLQCLKCHAQAGVRYRPGEPRPEPTSLAATSDGRTLFAASEPLRALAVVDLAEGRLRRMAPLPGVPRGVALSPDERLVAVTLCDTDRVLLLDAESLELRAEIPVGAEPAGVAFAARGTRLVVANGGSRDASVIDVASGAEITRFAAGRDPWTVAAAPEGGLVAVVSRMAEPDLPEREPRTEVTLLDPEAGVVVRRVGIPSCHLAESAAFADGRHLLVPLLRVRNLLPILQVGRGWVMSAALALVDVETGAVDLLPLCDAQEGFSDPTAISVDRSRGLVHVASGGGDRVAVLDLAAVLAAAGTAPPAAPEDFSRSAEYVRTRFAAQSNPRAVVLAPDGLVVAERLSDALTVYGPEGAVLRRIPLGAPVAEDEVRRGDRVFHDARYAFQGWFSCRSCHPSAHTDGLTYDFEIDGIGRDVVLNRSLRGVAGTDPFKWIGTNPTLQRQCGPRFAMVLTRADPIPADLADDLAAYLESLPPPRPVAAAGRDPRAAERGREIFHRAVRKDGTPIDPSGRCVTCHPPPHYTNRLKADVGTGGPRDRTGLFDTPHLTGIASKAPYLHDGRATTLESIWTAEGVGDSHGAMTDLDKHDLNDLVEFLRGL